MGTGMSLILPGLYVGSFKDSRDKEALAANQISHIVSIHDNAKALEKGKKYLCIRISDSPHVEISAHFPEVNHFIHSARLKGGAVLVHCLAGMSRSVTLVAAYILTTQRDFTWRESLMIVQGGRRQGNPNFGFRSQLKSYESGELENERKRLDETFPDWEALLPSDKESCNKNLQQYWRWNSYQPPPSTLLTSSTSFQSPLPQPPPSQPESN